MTDASHALMQAIMDHTSDSIITINSEGSIVTFNKVSEKIFGYKTDEILQQNIKLLLENPQTTGFFDSKTKEMKIPFGMFNIPKSIHFKCKDGSCFFAQLAVSQWIDNEEMQYVWITRDITERKRLNEMKNSFISMLNHELRTPMTAISGALSLILNSEHYDETLPQTKKLLVIAHRNSEKLVTLINDILKFL